MDDDEPHKIWFYTREGEKRGPVSFTDLRAKAKETSLDPRLDMVWTKGMSEWKLAGDIEGLFKRGATDEPQEASAPGLDAEPYQPPSGQPAEEQMARQGAWPGARRRSYLLLTVVFPLLWLVAVRLGTGFPTTKSGPAIMKLAVSGLILVPLLVVVYVSLKRLLNLGMSRWWILGNLVPLLNFWVGYRCFACPAGYAHHKKLDGAGKFLAIVFGLLWLLFLGFVIAAIAVDYGSLGTPEQQQRLDEIIRKAIAPKP